MDWDGPVASVFGSARVRDGDREFEVARLMGAELAGRGWAVMTGGYAGVMTAASRGAREAGGHVIGVTVRAWTNTPNEWLSHERPADDLFDRLRTLVSADALIAVGGGVGTLAEVALAWNLRQKHAGDAVAPLILVGEPWRRVVDVLARELVMDATDTRHIHLAADPTAAAGLLDRG